MSIWDRLLRRKRVEEFTGAPSLRRIKTYAAQTGYVYQYYFSGSRNVENSKEYRFCVRANGPEYSDVFLQVPETLVLEWAKVHGRPLSPTEQYGVAKCLLFQHFDDVESADLAGSVVVLTRSTLERISSELDLN